MTFIDTRSVRSYDRLQRRRLELTQATPDQPVDDEAVYLNVAGCYIRLSEYEGVCPLCRGDVCEAMSRLQELALSLAHKCLSFDFVGTSLDESSEEFGTVPSAWRPVLEDPSTLQIFFYYYAIAFSLISKELNYSEGAVGVNGSYGFRNLAGSVVHVLCLFGDAITSAEANIFSELSFTVDVSGLDKTSIIKHLRERTSAPIKEVKSAFVNCNWDIVLGATQCRGCTKRPEEKRCGVSLKKSSRTAAEGAEAMFADLGHFSVRSIQAKHRRRHQELTQTIPDQLLDDQAVYYKVAGDCPKRCVYSLRSLWRKKRRYVDPDASTSQVLAQRGMSNFMILRRWSRSYGCIFKFRGYGEPIGLSLETECMNSVSDPWLIRDGTETEHINSVSDPLLIRDRTKTEFILATAPILPDQLPLLRAPRPRTSLLSSALPCRRSALLPAQLLVLLPPPLLPPLSFRNPVSPPFLGRALLTLSSRSGLSPPSSSPSI
ncbi:hypothetical protein Syun_018708 [Stephania yunnanensis]|uniref:Uncharacterized protein n=1 Tax=Stephania yunnanensis TaxID=152371 RepID=A0AAP0NYN1_9MAGN